MTFEDAVRRAVKAYFKGDEPQNFLKQNAKRPRYTKKYFDKFEEEQFGTKTVYDPVDGVKEVS